MSIRMNVEGYDLTITPQHIHIYNEKKLIFHISLHRKTKMRRRRPIRLESVMPSGRYFITYFASIDNVRNFIKDRGLDLPVEIFDMMNAQLTMKEMVK